MVVRIKEKEKTNENNTQLGMSRETEDGELIKKSKI